MQKNCIIISANGKESFSSEQLNLLKDFNITFHKESTLISSKKFIEIVKNFEIVAITRRILKDIDFEIFQQLPILKGLLIYSTGYEWIDTDYLKKNKIKVSYLPNYSTIAVAEHAVAMLLSSFHRLHLRYDASKGLLNNNVSLRGFELNGKKIGIIGFGNIGQMFYSLMKSFGVSLKYYDTDETISYAKEDREDLNQLLKTSDALVICASKKRNSLPIIGRNEISIMKNGVFLINPARADLVDNISVVEGIKSKTIFTYAVDEEVSFFKNCDIEPGRILETKHTAWYTTEAIEKGMDEWVKNIVGMLSGSPQNILF